jgi:prepilin-type N-terminal cleavage/methylation domain-containing protein
MTKNTSRNGKGFTLTELLIAAAILIFLFAGILMAFFRCIQLGETSRNSSMALVVAKNRMEQIRNTAFDQIRATYHNATFTSAGINGIGVSYVDNTNPKLYVVRVAFCWREKNGRVFGEDFNLDGQVSVDEDKNNNGFVDSPVQVIASVYDEG